MRRFYETDPLGELEPGDPCWCRSGASHVTCHGNPLPPSAPGAPITAKDDDDYVYISPTAAVEREWLEVGSLGAPVFLPDEVMTPPRLIVLGAVARMTQPSRRTSPGLAALGAQRFEMLDFLGLADPGRLAKRLAELSEREMSDLRLFFLAMARSTLDCLSGEDQSLADKAVVWAGDADPTTMVGATLLWADHYLVTDRVAELLASNLRTGALAQELREFLALRPLIETGMVVPVLEGAAALAAAEVIQAGSEADLGSPGLVEWVDSQVVMEGPTARECVLYSAIDDDAQEVSFRPFGRIFASDETTRMVWQRMLCPYDPDFDYGPWIAQTRSEHVASIVQDVNKQVAIANALGADWITTSPFKQRLLVRRGVQPSFAQALIHAKVPQLSGASARALARVAAEADSVNALRNATAESLRAMRTLSPSDQRAEAADLGRKLQEQADDLTREIGRDRRWKLAAAGLVGVGGAVASTVAVAIGSAGPMAAPVDLLSGWGSLLGPAAGMLPYVADRASHRQNSAFALLIGDGVAPPRQSSRPARQRSVTPITAIMSEAETHRPESSDP